jgi:hypothetical protein
VRTGSALKENEDFDHHRLSGLLPALMNDHALYMAILGSFRFDFRLQVVIKVTRTHHVLEHHTAGSLKE